MYTTQYNTNAALQFDSWRPWVWYRTINFSATITFIRTGQTQTAEKLCTFCMMELSNLFITL